MVNTRRTSKEKSRKHLEEDEAFLLNFLLSMMCVCLYNRVCTSVFSILFLLLLLLFFSLSFIIFIRGGDLFMCDVLSQRQKSFLRFSNDVASLWRFSSPIRFTICVCLARIDSFDSHWTISMETSRLSLLISVRQGRSLKPFLVHSKIFLFEPMQRKTTKCLDFDEVWRYQRENYAIDSRVIAELVGRLFCKEETENDPDVDFSRKEQIPFIL